MYRYTYVVLDNTAKMDRQYDRSCKYILGCGLRRDILYLNHTDSDKGQHIFVYCIFYC